MASYKDVDKLLKEDGEITDLLVSKSKMRNLLLDLIENKLDNFKYETNNDYSYLLKIFDYFPFYFQVNFNDKKEYYLRMTVIRGKIKDLIHQKPGNVSKNSRQFQFLKKLIDNLENSALSFLYNDYIHNYNGSKYDFINYLIFDVKRISLVEDAIKRFPYIVNVENKDSEPLIDNVIKKYIDELNIYTAKKELNNLDDLIYYDEVLKLLLNSNKLHFDIVKQKEWLKNINSLIENINPLKFNALTKQKYVFFLNDLCDLIVNKQNCDLDYLEYKYDVKCNFNQSINAECSRVLNNKATSERYVIKDDTILTFDGKDAKEIDDALSIRRLENGNYYLGVHIADPLFFVKNNSVIYDEAKKRTTSIYLSDFTVSMFPSALSSNLASLLEGQMRPATSYYYEISSTGELVNSQFFKSYIYVYKNMTYQSFNEILDNGCCDEKIMQTITDLASLEPLLSKIYRIDPYYKEINRQNMNITDTNIIGSSISEKVVESAMVYNNHQVATYFNSRGLPFIYRVHAVNESERKKLDQFSQSINLTDSKSEYLKYINIIKNVYPRAIYSFDNYGHTGLNLESYAHITSPLRRFADILASECLDKFYFNKFDDKDVYYFSDNLKDSINKINQKRLSIEVFSNNYEKNKRNNG